MAFIPADSKAYIKPFEGTDVTCLLLDVVEWFGADEIMSILNQNTCSTLRSIPASQKALWKQLEPRISSEKQFITALGVRMLIGRSQNIDFVPPQPPPPCTSVSYYNNTPLDQYPSVNYPASTVCFNQPRFELSKSMHNLGNIFINEAIYDVRAYPELDEINSKINRIYTILLNNNNTTSAT
ncbi:calyx/pep-1 [Matsumuraeses phaseoli granulovirus]|uniref:Calyx/pep-1 n=1 Tax=Matsumuraeses phaseoli granulovirus TaxID=2760664 RepID=A0AAE7SXN1_9BBAC|nr:calyx/pep-1 [Matsumuraeses phaseoli granulovirus]QOD39983.1 calyx/pep-1 [Matsumuraeses phaseoli granulovirus]